MCLGIYFVSFLCLLFRDLPTGAKKAMISFYGSSSPASRMQRGHVTTQLSFLEFLVVSTMKPPHLLVLRKESLD